jgi:cardiolipin synthase
MARRSQCRAARSHSTVVLAGILSLGIGCLAERTPLRFGDDLSDHGPALSSALFQTVGATMKDGHRVDVLDNGEVFDALVAEIGTAQRSIHVVIYIWDDGHVSDRIVAAIAERAQAGVVCRILVDAVGTRDFFEVVAPKLAQAGCETRPYAPHVEIQRNHRKLVVIDGRVAITGGFGIRDAWMGRGRSDGEWRDAAVRFVGPAVRDAQQAFAINWLEAGGALLGVDALPTATEPAGSVRAALVSSTAEKRTTRAERLLQLMIASANERLWIANAYFVPLGSIRKLLQERAAAGVDVRVLTTGRKSNWKVYHGLQRLLYGDLLRHGVRVFEYEPAMMHSKTMLVDDELSVIGTINIDAFSLRNNEEDALVIEDRATNAQLARTFLTDCAHARERKR